MTQARTFMAQPRTALWLVVSTSDGVDHDVALELSDGTTVAAVTDALRDHLGVAGERTELTIPRTGDVLDPAAGFPVLRVGEVVRLGTPSRTPLPSPGGTGSVDLVVCGGPLVGTRVSLGEGEHVVGRGSGTDVKLSDPAMSRRHLKVAVSGAGVSVSDAGSSNGTFIDGVPVSEPHLVAPGEIVEAGSSLIGFEPPTAAAPSASDTQAPTVPFNRPPRVRLRAVPFEYPLDAPPARAESPRFPLAASLIPLLLGVVLVLLFPDNKVMLLFFAFSPVMAVWSVIEQRRTGKKTFGTRAAEFKELVTAREHELESARRDATQRTRALFPAASELLERARNVSSQLWERRIDDEDFLHVRVGWGDEPSGFKIGIAQGGDPDLRTEAEQRLQRFSVLPSVPVPVALGAAGVTAVIGSINDAPGLARWIVAQCAVLHSPDDLVVAAVLGDGGDGEPDPAWAWLKWLPHVSFGEPLRDPRPVAAGRDGPEVLARIAAVIDARRSAPGAVYGGATPAGPFVLVLVDGAVTLPRDLVTTVLRDGPAVGVVTLWMGDDAQHLPGEVKTIVAVDTANDRLTITYPAEGETLDRSGPEMLSTELATDIARALAPIRDVSRRSAAGDVPATIDLVEMVPVTSADQVERGWDGAGGLSAPIGLASGGVFSLDLRRDGPHCLVGGTTGAGKSELLQTAVASLAAAYPPEKLNFILLDYKGGTAFKDCVLLPHVVGAVTDLDGALARRALISLDAELKRREEILRTAGARDLFEMETQDPNGTPPHLVLVIDEFATLVKELPDFVDGVVDVAQRGRGLGINLILATQRPAGVVNEKIRANTNLRICLRVGDESDSLDVIGIPDAARIERSMPGRAYARVGHAEVFAFQAAFGGRPAPRPGAAVAIAELGLAGPRRALGAGTSEGETQLQGIVTAIVEAAATHPRPRQPWLPPLPERIPLHELESSTPDKLVIGTVDEPSRQRRRPYSIDLDAVGSVLIYGTAAAGKTTLLRTIACALAQSSSPSGCNIYGLDFSTHGLRVLEDLPHCGSVIAGDDEERVQRLFSTLRAEVLRRRELLTARGVASLGEVSEISDVPKIVVLLDGYSAFASAFEKVNLGELVDLLPRLIADGRQLGIHFVIAAERRAAVPGAIASLVQTRIVLRLADEDEYSSVGVDLRVARGIKLPPGRGFVDGASLMQSAIVSDGGGGEIEAIAARGQELRARHGELRAPALQLLPTEIPAAALEASAIPLVGALGVDEEMRTAVVDLREGHFLVAGPYRSGRSTALMTAVRDLRAASPDVSFHLLAPRRSALSGLSVWTSTAQGLEGCDAAAATLAQDLTGDEGSGSSIIVVDDGDELLDSGAAFSLEKLVRAGRDGSVRVLAAVESHALHRSFGGWGAEIRKEKHGLLLDPDHDLDGDLLGCRLPRRRSAPFPPGRGYVVRRGSFVLIQVAAG